MVPNFGSLFEVEDLNLPDIQDIQVPGSSQLNRRKMSAPISHSQRPQNDQYGTGRAGIPDGKMPRQSASNGPAGQRATSDRVDRKASTAASLRPNNVVVENNFQHKNKAVSQEASKNIRRVSFLYLSVDTSNIASYLTELPKRHNRKQKMSLGAPAPSLRVRCKQPGERCVTPRGVVQKLYRPGGVNKEALRV